MDITLDNIEVYDTRAKLQEKRMDQEVFILQKCLEELNKLPDDRTNNPLYCELTKKYCILLGDITEKELIHKLNIYLGIEKDDEISWRQNKYGGQPKQLLQTLKDVVKNEGHKTS